MRSVTSEALSQGWGLYLLQKSTAPGAGAAVGRLQPPTSQAVFRLHLLRTSPPQSQPDKTPPRARGHRSLRHQLTSKGSRSRSQGGSR